MRITPLDVRKQEFKRGMRGYDSDEVRAFLSTLADEYEAVLVDNKQLRERVVEQDEKLSEYRNLEQTLRDTLMTAERVTQDAKETARKEGEVLVQQAQQRVERVLAEARERLNELRREALAVHREKEAYLGRFRSLAEAQIHFVEQHRQDFVDLDGRLLEQADALPNRHQQSTPSSTAAYQDSHSPQDSRSQAGPFAPQDSAPAAPVEYGPDEWREYAIASAEQVSAATDPGEIEHIADVVQQAEQTVQNEEADDEKPVAEVAPAPEPATEDVQRT